jgi:hypothetical protein
VPHTLILAIPALHLLMHSLLHLTFEDARASRLVVVGDFQNVGRVNPVVRATPHHMVVVHRQFIDRHIAVCRTVDLAVVVSGHLGRIVLPTAAGRLDGPAGGDVHSINASLRVVGGRYEW